MRKTICPLWLAVLLLWVLAACSKSSSFQLKVEGMGDAPLLLVGDDPVSRVDTLFPEQGKLTYTFTPDTLYLFRLLTDSGTVIPLFADKSWRVELKGGPRLQLKGDGPNKEYGQFLESIDGDSEEEAAAKAEQFILGHPHSYVSAYLIDRCFVQVPSPDPEKIKQLVEPLGGDIKDSRMVALVLKSLAAQQSDSKYLSYYTAKDRQGRSLSWSSKADYSLTLVQLWATWDDASRQRRQELYRLLKEFRPDEFRVVNVSLDYSLDDWQQACRKDTTQWMELCDRKGWENAIVKQFNIRRLPANFLVDKSRKILACDLYGDDLKEQALRLLGEAKEKARKTDKQ